MAKVYVKKVSVVNKNYFKKLGLDPAKMSLSQRNFTDRLITLVKPCSNKEFREDVWQLILDFVEKTNGLDRNGIRNTFSSVIHQINHRESQNDSRREYKFNIEDYGCGEIMLKLQQLASNKKE